MIILSEMSGSWYEEGFTFTNCEIEGSEGPTKEQCLKYYNNNWEGFII